ncbi:MAG: hypothetical protein Q8L98_01360 [Chlamydiales bacterium]|nr:hypothetical protein [Chlamydiales bacterium]
MSIYHYINGDALRLCESFFAQLYNDSEMIAANSLDGPPYVKLQTNFESDSRRVEAASYVIPPDQYSLVFQAYAGSRNYVANTVNHWGMGSTINSWSWGYIDPWNCNRQKTGEALETGLNGVAPCLEALREKAQINDVGELKNVKEDLLKLEKLFSGVKKTIFFVYRTYDHSIGEGITEQGNGPEEIFVQYERLSDMLGAISDLKDQVEEKIGVDATLPQPMPKVQDSFSFKTEADASLWFCHQMIRCRNAIFKSNPFLKDQGVYNDLMKQSKLSKDIPDTFKRFAKELDEAVARERGSEDFVQELYHRFLKQLGESENVIPPISFSEWLETLCREEASLDHYKAIFKALMNDSKNGPYRLNMAPRIMNTMMMNPQYFLLFDHGEKPKVL